MTFLKDIFGNFPKNVNPSTTWNEVAARRIKKVLKMARDLKSLATPDLQQQQQQLIRINVNILRRLNYHHIQQQQQQQLIRINVNILRRLTYHQLVIHPFE
jgi:hypothetical protein